jgi:O-antigen/teichoic acid export membrane protein
VSDITNNPHPASEPATPADQSVDLSIEDLVSTRDTVPVSATDNATIVYNAELNENDDGNSVRDNQTLHISALDGAEPSTADGKPIGQNSANTSGGRLARNALFSYVAMFAGTLVGFFVTPYLLSHLGAEHFGLWVLLLTVVGYLGLLEVGLYTTISKRVAECMATGDNTRMGTVLSTAFVMYCVLAGAVLLIGLMLVVLVDRLFHLPQGSTSLARSCMALLILNQMVVFAFRLQPALLFGAGRMDLLTGIGTIYNLLTAIINVTLAAAGYSIVVMAGWTVVATTVSGLVGRALIQRHLPPIEIHPRFARREMTQELLKYGSRNAALSIAGTVAFGADALVIGLLLPITNVAHYTVAARLANVIRELCHKPVDVLMPAYSHSEAQGDAERQFQLWTESVALSMAVALPFVVASWAFGERIVTAWVGPGHEISGFIFAILALMQWLQLPGHGSSALLTGTERNIFLVRLTIVAAVVNLALSLGLTHLLGPVGVAIASLIVVATADFIILPVVVCRLFGFSYAAYWKQSLLPLVLPTLAGIGTTVTVLLFNHRYGTEPLGRLNTVILLLAVCFVCWMTWLLFAIGKPRRERYLRSVRSAVKR